jgi:hypothetical protein
MPLFAVNWSLWFTYILLNQLVVYTAAPLRLVLITEGIKPVCKNSSLRFKYRSVLVIRLIETLKLSAQYVLHLFVTVSRLYTRISTVIISCTVFFLHFLKFISKYRHFLVLLALLGARIAQSSQWLHYGFDDRGIKFNYKQEQKIIFFSTMSGLALSPTDHPTEIKGNRNQ